MSTALWTNFKFYGPELLQVADSVAMEKGIDPINVIEAMEDAIQKAASAKYGTEYDIRARIDNKTGEVSIKKYLTVVESPENEFREISLESALKSHPNICLGDEISEDLPPIEFGRGSAQMGRQIVVQKFRNAERQRQYDEFKDRVGTIVGGIVKRAEFNSVTIDVGRTEAVIRRDQLIGKENFRVGDRVRAYIVSVSREERGPQVFLSRTHPNFLAQLFVQEVPEIYDGIIEIKSVARDPGSRAKIAVVSKDSAIDPIGACVGVRGNRVQAVVQELQGEKVDIVLWSPDLATFAVNALAPAEVSKVVLDEDNNKFEVLVADDQLSLAIGRRGQNVRLAAQLIKFNLEVVSEAEDTERKNQLYHARSQAFIDALDCDEMMAHLLVSEGFTSIEEIAYSDIEDLLEIEGVDESIVQELKERAILYLEKKDLELTEKLKSAGVADDLVNFEIISRDQCLRLSDNGIKCLDDLGDLAVDELTQILDDIDEECASSIIMEARKHWFEEEK